MVTTELSAFPRACLSHLPTPLEDAPRLTERLGGPTMLIKRDDLTSTGAGGNKIRKLEFLLGEALANKADSVITFGAVQTNHGRQTAAACARLGLRCELVLTDLVPKSGDAYEGSGNILLDRVYGATVHRCADGDETAAVHQRLVEEAEAEGRTVATLPLGGSNAVGVLGYLVAAGELFGQLTDRGIDTARLVVPCSSGGTAAGLVLGKSVLNWPGTIDIACVSHPADETEAVVSRLAGEAAELLGVNAPTMDGVRFDDVSLGAGYGIPDDAVWRAIELFGSTAGLALDPVYTGKAAAALPTWISAGRITADEQVVFLHTGGMPGLFGYAPDVPEVRPR